MKYYKHKITGRIINEFEYEHRISEYIKHYFVHMENADDDRKPENVIKSDEPLFEDLL